MLDKKQQIGYITPVNITKQNIKNGQKKQEKTAHSMKQKTGIKNSVETAILNDSNSPVKPLQSSGNGGGNFPPLINRRLVARALGLAHPDVINFINGKREKVGRKRWKILTAWAIEQGYMPAPVKKPRHECPLCGKGHVVKGSPRRISDSK